MLKYFHWLYFPSKADIFSLCKQKKKKLTSKNTATETPVGLVENVSLPLGVLVFVYCGVLGQD